MTGCRHLLRKRWIAALAVIVVALLARMAIPTGYMPMVEHGRFVIVLCAEQNAGLSHASSAMPEMGHMAAMPAKADHPGNHGMPDHDQNGSCGFGGLSLASLAAADPIVLALAIAFIVASVFRHTRTVPVAAPDFLWPPRTGPPARA